jgi:excisionase family DNA binding protein
MKDYLTINEIAQIEKINRMTVSRWVHRGVFPNARRIGRVYRIPFVDYVKWRDATRVHKAMNVHSHERLNERSNERTP